MHQSINPRICTTFNYPRVYANYSYKSHFMCVRACVSRSRLLLSSARSRIGSLRVLTRSIGDGRLTPYLGLGFGLLCVIRYFSPGPFLGPIFQHPGWSETLFHLRVREVWVRMRVVGRAKGGISGAYGGKH